MNKAIFVTMLILLVACAVNPLTGKKQLSLVDSGTVNQLAAEQYAEIKRTSKILSPATNANAQMVTRVGSRIADGITRYYSSKGLSQYLADFKWEYMLIDEPTVNAWCMPGGKIAIYSGILPVTKNENALGVVMGHEVAHAIAQHGKERMSQGLIQQFGGMALSVALSNKPAATQQLFNQAYQVGTTTGLILPFGRNDELEADKLGLIYCAVAGYNPQESIAFWKRMSAIGGQKPPEWLSTHPSDESRIAQLEQMMPEAMAIYEANKYKKNISK